MSPPSRSCLWIWPALGGLVNPFTAEDLVEGSGDLAVAVVK
jgi:hypothetical protein